MTPNPRQQRRSRVPFSLVLSLVLASVVTPGGAQKPTKQDTVKLQNGNELEGRILAESESSLTIRIGPGQEIEIPKTRIATYSRLSRPEDPAAEAVASPWHQRDSWFLLRNADGAYVGKLHMLVHARGGKGYALEQQWTFVDARIKTLVSRVENVDRSLAPRSFQYRETVVRRRDERVQRERLVRGEVRHEKLLIDETNPAGRQKRSIPFPAGNLFPMLVEELLRRGGADQAHSFAASVFDPLDGTFELRRYSLVDGVPSPTPPRAGASVRDAVVRLIECDSRGRRRREWVARDGRILLAEVNGVNLVAEPVAAETGLRTRSFDKIRAVPTWRPFAGLELWLPAATWKFGREVERGRVLDLVVPIADASVRVCYLDSKTDEVLLLGAADDFVRRWLLDEPWFKERSRDSLEIGGRACVRVDGGGKAADGKLRLGRVFVLEAPTGYLVVAAAAPAKTWDFLAPDLDALISGLRATRTELAAAPEHR